MLKDVEARCEVKETQRIMTLLECAAGELILSNRRNRCDRVTRDVNGVMDCKVTGRDCMGKKENSPSVSLL